MRAGLVPALTGATISDAEVFDARSLKRHISVREKQLGQISPNHGKTLDLETQKLRETDFITRIVGAKLLEPARRGKFLWVPFAAHTKTPEALFAHLAMSGQILLREPEAPDDKHVRIRLWVEAANGRQLRVDFADQRRFGSLAIDVLEKTADGLPAGCGTQQPLLPAQAAHIARDLLDEYFDFAAAAKLLKQKPSAIKKLLLDQRLLSGIGNIYADEALWEAQIHPETPAHRLSIARIEKLLLAAANVMSRALAEGGTSFDALYVNTNGEAGYFARSLKAYGRNGKSCYRCESLLTSSTAIGRTSHFCPVCQKKR